MADYRRPAGAASTLASFTTAIHRLILPPLPVLREVEFTRLDAP